MKLQLLVLTFFIPLLAFSQNKGDESYKINLKSGIYLPKESNQNSNTRKNSSLRTNFAPSYKLIQFYQLPKKDQINKLMSAGINLLEYIPNNAYLAYVSSDPNTINTSDFKIRAIEEISTEFKIDEQLKKKNLPSHIMKEDGKIALVIKYFKNQTPESVRQKLIESGFQIIKSLPEYNQFELLTSQGKIEELAKISAISYIYPVAPPFKIHNVSGIKHHNINVLNSPLNNGRNLNGEGITIGVGDGGYLDFHHDYQKKIKNIDSEYPSLGFHAMHVAGIIAGAGNINPDIRGGASKARVLNYSFQNVILNAPHNFKNNGMVITNNSYGFEGYHGFYDFNSALIDKMIIQNPYILHVFASGNEYDVNTVSGGFNSAKNVLTVGSIDKDDFIGDYSSKGPVNDGRIKPEVVAVGTDITSLAQENSFQILSGTSMASPLVSSTAALLYQRFRQINNTNPEAGLIKAVLCNTSEDLGNFGPDYYYGFGKINARKAVEALEGKNYFIDSVKNGATKTINLNIPANAYKTKILLYWNDVEASNVSAVSLVNDLDLEVSFNGEKWLPWKLDPNNPNESAVYGKDRINNIEQITIDNPVAGTYSIKVKGFKIPFANAQKFFVTYEVVNPELVLTHPAGGESFAPGDQVEIKWDNFSDLNVNLEFSKDNGTTWESIEKNVQYNITSIYWTVPDLVSSGMIRLKSGKRATTGGAFNIIATPTNLKTVRTTSQSVNFTWNKVKGATEYDVYLLAPEDDEIKLIGTTTTNTFPIKALNKSASYLFSVRARTKLLVGKRAIASIAQFNEPVITFTSPVKSSFKSCENITISADVKASPSASKVDFLVDGIKVSEDWVAPYETKLSYVPGNYIVEVQVTNEYGATSTNSKEISIKSPAQVRLPFLVDFEKNNGEWTVIPEGNENIWFWGIPEGKKLNSGAKGSNGWFTNIKKVKKLEEYSVVTPSINLRNVNVPVVLSFKQNLLLTANDEGVFVEMSTDCGESWISLGSRTSKATNWYDSKISHWNGYYFSNKDAWTSSTSGWREVKIVIPYEDFADQDVQFKLSYYLGEKAVTNSEGLAIDDFKIDYLTESPINKKDSLALVKMYNSLNGKNWYFDSNWLTDNVNSWYGVETFDGRVTSVALWNNNLLGEIPKEVGDLEELKYLSLSYNQVKGKLPAEIGKLEKLAVLDIDKGKLTGPLPKEIGNCKNLYWLFLSNNQLEGSLPQELGNLKKLEWAFFDFNKISGTIPVSLKNCSNLEWINLNYNRLSGIPDLNGAIRIFEINAQKNKLTFRDIEPNLAFFPYSYYYESQDTVGEPSSHEVGPGATVTLNANFAGESSNNRYQWFKDGKEVTEILNTPTYELPNLPSGFNGEFTCAITNIKVKALTLWTQPMRVKVKASESKVLYRVNAGGTAPIPASPVKWEADRTNNNSEYWVKSNSSLTEGGSYWVNRTNNTGAPNSIFGSFRNDWGKEGLRYEFPVQNGNYTVNLYFAEKDNSWRLGPPKNGDHVQDIFIENKKVLEGFDMFAVNGYNAIKKTFNIWVFDGKLNLALKGTKGSAYLNGMEIVLIKEAGARLADADAEVETVQPGSFNIYPNPVSNNSFKINLKNTILKTGNLEIYDQFGNKFYNKRLDIDGENIEVNLNAIQLKSGIYFVKLTSDDSGSTQVAKLIKE